MAQSGKNINELFGRYFRGQLSEDEYETLTELLKTSDGRELFKKAKEQWAENPASDGLVQKNWARLNYRLYARETPKVVPLRANRFLYKAASYAAILVIGLLVGILAHSVLRNSGEGQQFVFETPRGEKSKVTLPDGSEVWLNAKTKLTYFVKQKERKAELSGEAFFKVAHDKSKPFTIVTPECNVEVVGTSFNVMAYEEFGRNEITLLEGKVKVYSGAGSKMLSPGQAMSVKNGQMNIAVTEAEQAIAWVGNKFNFNNIPLEELVKRLENWYDVDIQLKDNIKNDITFTGVFKNEETIWQVLDALKVYIPIDYQRTNSRKVDIWIKQ